MNVFNKTINQPSKARISQVETLETKWRDLENDFIRMHDAGEYGFYSVLYKNLDKILIFSTTNLYIFAFFFIIYGFV